MIKQAASDIRHKIYGRDVRESLAKGLEVSGDIADESNKRSKDTEDRQSQLEARYDVAVGAHTEETELLDARVGKADGLTHTNLKNRLDYEYDFQLDRIKEISVNPKDFGAVGDGIHDDTDAILAAIETGYLVEFPKGDFIFNGEFKDSHYMLSGVHETLSRIITTSDVVFDNLTTGIIKRLNFKSLTPLKSTLFYKERGTFKGSIEYCIFDDYDYHLHYPGNANGIRLHKCIFREGNHGVVANLAHAASITKCEFWQQHKYSMIMSRGTSGEIEGNSFVGTQGRPSEVKLFSNSHTFENNYFEFYPSSGENHEAMITVEYNRDSTFPFFINNTLNGKDIVNYNIKFVNVGDAERTHQRLLMFRNTMLNAAVAETNLDFKKFTNVYMLGEDIPTPPQKMHYISNVKDVATSTSRVDIPLNAGTVIDPLGMGSSDHKVRPNFEGKDFMVTVTAEMQTELDVKHGMEITIIDENGSGSKVFNFLADESQTGLVQSPTYQMLHSTLLNTAFRVSMRPAPNSGYARPAKMSFVVKIEEVK
jgi:hypothetical protein